MKLNKFLELLDSQADCFEDTWLYLSGEGCIASITFQTFRTVYPDVKCKSYLVLETCTNSERALTQSQINVALKPYLITFTGDIFVRDSFGGLMEIKSILADEIEL